MQESCLTQFGEQNVVTSLSCATGEVIGLAVLTRRTLFVVGSIVFVLLTGKCVYAYKIKKYRAQCVCIGLADAVIELAAVRLVMGHLIQHTENKSEMCAQLCFTVMRRLTTGIRSEKCVVRRFRHCANVI